MLISGCSNAAGFEINGIEDCEYNRQNSFGNLLAQKLDRKPINIAMGAQSNNAVARSVLSWFDTEYDSNKHDVFVLVAWTESARMDIPYSPPVDYANPGADWYCENNKHFININPGIVLQEWMSDKEKTYTHDVQMFMTQYGEYTEMVSWINVIMLQNFFKARNISYLMCNTMHMFDYNMTSSIYKSMVDEQYYYNMMDNDNAFYWYYRNLGYENPKAKYWHHNEVPHQLYAEQLHQFLIR